MLPNPFLARRLWLGESDSNAAAAALLADPAAAVATSLALGTKYGVAGVNFDLEVSTGADQAGAYAAFLAKVAAGLRGRMRVTADVDCNADGRRRLRGSVASRWGGVTAAHTAWPTAIHPALSPGRGFAPIIGNCTKLAAALSAPSGLPRANRVLNMASYNSASLAAFYAAMAPALAVPRGQLGAGLGVWNASEVPAWSLTPAAARDRLCALANFSVEETDLFRIAPELGWPPVWWIAPLRAFLRGGGCPLPPVPPSRCPATGWIDAAPGCCTAGYNAINRTRCPPANDTSVEACAEWQCRTGTKGIDVWVSEDFRHHPYTCCDHRPVRVHLRADIRRR